MMQQAAKRAQPGRGFHPHPADTVDAKLAPGEYVLPTDTVQQVGEENLDALLAATKTPGRGFSGKQGGKFFFAGGGLVPDEEKQKPSSFGDTAAVAQNPGTTAVPAPAAPATPQPPSLGFNPTARLNEQIANAEAQRARGIEAAQRTERYDSISQSQRQQAFNDFKSTQQPWFMPTPEHDLRAQQAQQKYEGVLSGRAQEAAPAAPPAGATPQTQSLVNAEEMQRRAQAIRGEAGGTTPAPAGQDMASRGLPGVYQHGRGQYSDNAQGMGFAPGFTGQPSAQNMQAADALAGQQQAQSMARIAAQQAAQQQPVAQARGFAPPQIKHSGNDFTARQNLRGLKSDAEWAMQRAPRKKYAMQDPAVMAYQAALKGDTDARFGGQANLEARTNDTNAGLQREQMQQDGANQRDAARGFFDQQRLALDTRKQARDEYALGFDVRKAQRAENAQSAFDRASPDQRSVIKEMYPDMFGSKEAKPFQLNVVRGSVDPSTGKRDGDYAVVFDPNTGEYRPMQIGGSAAVPPGFKPFNGKLDGQ